MNFYTSIFKKKYNSKLFVKKSIFISFFLFFFVVLINFLVDPIGIYRESFQFQNIQNKAFPKLVTYKIFSDYDYGIIGTSRSQEIDHRYTDKYNIKSKNLSLAGSSININYEILKEVKRQNKNAILFLDPYTLAKNYNLDDPKKIQKLEIIKSEVSKLNKNRSSLDFEYLTLGRTFLFSLKTLAHKISGKDRDFKYQKKNLRENYKIINTEKMIKESPIFKDYKIDYDLVYKSVDLLDKNDFLLVSPIIFEYYYQLHKLGVLDNYFDLLKSIMERNKELKIISFLYFNEDLLNGNLFDNTGSHYKHYYGKKIIDDIFSDKKKISIELTLNNFKEYRENIIQWLVLKNKELGLKSK